MPDPRAIVLIGACLELPGFTSAETSLLREIHLNLSMNTHQHWGVDNQHRQEEVRLLFIKCQEAIRNHVSQAHV